MMFLLERWKLMGSKRGNVKWFNEQKGYGFITANNGDVFVHINEIKKSGLDTLPEGAIVSYDAEERNGKTQAINIAIVEQS
jgi:CspA family cold shock protein